MHILTVVTLSTLSCSTVVTAEVPPEDKRVSGVYVLCVLGSYWFILKIL